MADSPDRSGPFRVRCSESFIDAIYAQVGAERAANFMTSYTMDDIMDIFRYEFDRLEKVLDREDTRALRLYGEFFPRIVVVGQFAASDGTIWLDLIWISQ